ncbi:hypothetical protein GCM10023322_55330 [Rugosimonospora acidiphila]|uniref:Uncharacterized protein n=1 Tax=Rugosimonospora acidiphila TaxID=556531 RepID=A0ABP9SCA2_9ACTN
MLAVGGIALYARRDGPKGDGLTASPAASASTTPPRGRARYSTDLAAVCMGRGYANVAPYEPGSAPKVAAFVATLEPGSRYVQQVIFQGRSPDPRNDFSSVSVVACLSGVRGSEGASKPCPSSSDPVYYMVPYRTTVTLYAAATGEKLGTAQSIDVPADRCPPVVAVFDPTNPNVYPTPTNDAIMTSVGAFFS